MKIHVIDGHENDVEDLREALNASGVVGTWDWHPAARPFRFDRGVAEALAGNANLAGMDLDGVMATACVHPADVDWLMQDVCRVLDTGGLFLAEFRTLVGEGGVRWMLCRGRIDLDDAGRAVRGRGLLIDITEGRDAGHGYVTRPRGSSGDPLDEAAALCLQAHDCLQAEGAPFLRILLNTVLLELGHQIARRIKTRTGH